MAHHSPGDFADGNITPGEVPLGLIALGIGGHRGLRVADGLGQYLQRLADRAGQTLRLRVEAARSGIRRQIGDIEEDGPPRPQEIIEDRGVVAHQNIGDGEQGVGIDRRRNHPGKRVQAFAGCVIDQLVRFDEHLVARGVDRRLKRFFNR